MSSTLFTGGTIWTGDGDTDALLVTDGVVTATGRAAQRDDAHVVDLGGGFLMPSFGDGHAHPLYGGLEAVGPAVRSCSSHCAWLSLHMGSHSTTASSGTT